MPSERRSFPYVTTDLCDFSQQVADLKLKYMNFHRKYPATCATRFHFKRILILLKLLRGKGVAQVAGHICMEISTFGLKIYDLLQQVAQVGPHMRKAPISDPSGVESLHCLDDM